METFISQSSLNSDTLSSVLGFMQPYQTLISLVLGFAVLLFGYRIKKTAFFAIWFILGFLATAYFMPTIVGAIPQIAENSLYQNLLTIAGGLLPALLGFSIEKFCVSGIAFALSMLVAVTYFGTDMSTLVTGGIVGVIAAGAAVLMMKPVTIILTALAGAYAMLFAAFVLLPDFNFGLYYWPILFGLTLMGSVFQFLTTKNR